MKSCADAFPIVLPLVLFLTAFWPRIYKWLDDRENEARLRLWQHLCPTCGYDTGHPHAGRTCEKCQPMEVA